MRTLRLTLALLFVLSLVSGARAQYFGQNKVQYQTREWSVAETKHFQVHFHEGEREAAMDVCRMAERAYDRLSTILRHEISRPVPIILYASQAEFQQTNVSEGLVGEGTGGFTEYYKGRVVLPLTGSYRDLDHVLTHELVHAFQVDVLFGNRNGVGNAFQYAPPLWFMEGMAEYLSLVRVDPQTEMWLRDGALEGYLTPLPVLERVGDLRNYRYGQSVLAYLGATFGDKAIGEVLKKVAATRNLPKAFEDELGITLEKFSENWIDHVRKTYLPTIRDHVQPEEFAFQLTHAERELSSLNLGPALSPDGDRMCFFSNPSLYNDLYLASAIDGKVERRLVKGERKADFESLRYYTSSVDWSPGGDRIVFVALRDGRDAIYVQEVETGEIVGRVTLPTDGAAFPSWSPDGEWIVFAGQTGGRSNLWRVRSDGSGLERLTNDLYLVQEPRFSPDGRRIVFVTDRGDETDLDQLLFSEPRLAIFDLERRSVDLLGGQSGRNVSPHFLPDGTHLVFASDRSGIPNLYLRDLESGEDRRITDILTGIAGLVPNGPCLSLSRNGKRLVFTAFSAGTWNLFAIKDPLDLWAKGEVWHEHPLETESAEIVSAEAEQRVLDGDADVTFDLPDEVRVAATSGTDGVSGDAILDPIEDDSLFARTPVEPLVFGSAPADSGAAMRASLDSLWADVEPVAAQRDSTEETPIVAAQVFREKRNLPIEGATEVEPYRPRFSADYVAANGFFQSSVGLAAQSVLRFSDLLGNRVLLVGVDVYGSLKDSNLLFEYINLKRRSTWGVSAFQFANDSYIFSTESGDNLLVRTYRGANLTVQRPWNRFRRVELSVEVLGVAEEIYDEIDGAYYATGRENTYYYVDPGIALVHDNTLWGYTGPISGARYRVTAETGIGDLNFRSYVADYRRYWNIQHEYAVAQRFVGARSEGEDPQFFRLGGPYTLRGYDYGEFAGTQLLLSNLEFRFPLIEQLRLGWPLPISLAGVRGGLFFDAGAAIDPDQSFQPFTRDHGAIRFEDLRGSYGLSASLNMGFTVLKWDLAWRTNLASSSKSPRGFLSFGLDY